jgi:hypothetical protein
MDAFAFWLPFIDAARGNLCKLRFPGDISPDRKLRFPDNISPDWIKGHLTAMRCSPNYPETVAHSLMLARELCVAGCLFYELFTTSIQYSASACEVALKERFVELLPIPCLLTSSAQGRASEERVWTTRPSVDEFVHAIGQGWRLPAPLAGLRPTLGHLIRWALARDLIPASQTAWFEHRRQMRNTIAHGHNMVVAPSWALGTLRQTTVILNQLFPDAETTAYDDQVRKERETRDHEWWQELEGMLRMEPAAAGTDDEASEDDDLL